MKKNLKWRLAELPTTDDIKNLLEAGVITKEEAKDVFFREEEEKKIDRDKLKEEKQFSRSELNDLKDEIKLLRELVLANLGTKEVKIIEKHYHDDWYPRWTTYTNVPNSFPYIYCNAANIDTNTIGNDSITIS